ncbi:hypothetical protein BJ973_004409 [Actinoplanes tereljensis]|uniref:Uncharacterized protein n=1 Tax=Paractinoplanes tereljensis TaxID=571912 RepID=A0A919NSB2_9ACTN|nr:hypothetical protein [Actinoplanes tereljensis]GIF23798.1 hypothetical protein Ate02nite_65280 [Actinoplanes tereljensis]
MEENPEVGEALETLSVWLIAEDAYLRDRVPDEVLTYMQDRVGQLLGPHALQVAGDFARERDLVGLARDSEALDELLALIEGKRRRGFEMEWRAFPPATVRGKDYQPEALLVMAEYGGGDPVWDRPRGDGGQVELSELGVSASLVQRLRAWNDTWATPEPSEGWTEKGMALAHELQRELPDLDVRYFHGDDDRPLRSQ